MTSQRSIRIVTSAALAIKEAAAWWSSNRTKAPKAFVEELERALELIASRPMIGARAHNVKLPEVRCIHVARIHYDIYYRLASEPNTVEVLALWHTSRGKAPPL